jgi:hypothetical protein
MTSIDGSTGRLPRFFFRNSGGEIDGASAVPPSSMPHLRAKHEPRLMTAGEENGLDVDALDTGFAVMRASPPRRGSTGGDASQ